MGTIINGNKWSGACVNGSMVSGLAKNGAVFYKKENLTPSIYKRRIMVGDNLKGQTIYFDFPDDYYLIRGDDSDSGNHFLILCDNNYYQLVEMWDNDGKVIVSEMGYYYSTGHIYDFNDNINLSQVNNSPLIPAASLDVNAIYDEYPSYRHCYIEDPNIRPLQIGDKIINGTKLYFNFPDNLTNIEDKTIFSLDTMEDLYSKISSNKIYITDRVEPLLKSPVSTLSVEPTEEGAVVMKKIFDTEDSLNIINLSTYTYECYGYQEGIPVNEIDNELINYVLVDVTTLGN